MKLANLAEIFAIQRYVMEQEVPAPDYGAHGHR
jgi:hypothetical protein